MYTAPDLFLVDTLGAERGAGGSFASSSSSEPLPLSLSLSEGGAVHGELEAKPLGPLF